MRRILFHKLLRYHVWQLGSDSAIDKQTLSRVIQHYKDLKTEDVIDVKRDTFYADYSREVIFRGINIAAKTPVSRMDHIDAHKPKPASFVNTPFSLEDAHEHLSRLKYLGFNLLRWVVPWEAIAPISPDSHDEKYLEYLYEMMKLTKQYGFTVLIDFHQDVWSRFTGGSGAPKWTLEKTGFVVENFEKCLASISHQKSGSYPLGHLFWATNADRYAAKTMYTLFFGGKKFAPTMNIDGKNIQDYLQQHYISAVTAVAERLKEFDHITGYDIMNEPHLGYIGCKDLHKYHGLFRLGPSALPLQGFALSEGVTQKVDVFEKKMFSLKATRKKLYDPKGNSVWSDNTCLWRKQGVWGYADSKPTLLKKDYFQSHDPNAEFYVPFVNKVGKAIAKINDKTIVFIEHATNHPIPEIHNPDYKIGFSGHWYDAFVISMRKVWRFISVDMFTHKVKLSLPHFVQKNLSMQIFRLLKKMRKNLGEVPFLLSEFGIPFDLHNKKAYSSGKYNKQKAGLERSFKAVEKTLVSSILWNYTAINSNEKGDFWNNEDFSIFSLCQHQKKDDPYSGIRAKEAIIRPYPMKVPGKIVSYSFSSKTGKFSCRFTHNKNSMAPLEIFLPTLHYGKGFQLHISEGRYEVDYIRQKLLFYPCSHLCSEHKVVLSKKRNH